MKTKIKKEVNVIFGEKTVWYKALSNSSENEGFLSHVTLDHKTSHVSIFQIC